MAGLVVIEFSTDGIAWGSVGEWPADRLDERMKELTKWARDQGIAGSLRSRPITRTEAILPTHYPRLSDEERARILRHLNCEDPNEDYSD